MRLGFLSLTVLGVALGVPPATEAADSRKVPAALEQRARDLLKAAPRSPEFWFGMHACEALTQSGDAKFVRELLAEKIEHEPDRQRQCGLAREQVRAGDRLYVGRLLEILADRKANARVHAAESLFKIGEIGDGRLLRAAFDEQDDALMMAAAALARCGNRSVLAKVRQRLEHGNEESRTSAAWVLGQVGDAGDIPALRKAAERKATAYSRSFVFNAMARLGDAAAIEQVGRNLSHAETDVRTYAADALAGLRLSRFLPQYEKLLDDKHLDTRVRAAQAILLLDRPVEPLPSDISVTVYEATPEHPRYSEGSIAALRDGWLLFAVTQFDKQGGDGSPAQIVARSSHDGGRTWDKPVVLQQNIGGLNAMSVSLARLDAQEPTGGPLGMFFVVKNSSSDAYMGLRISQDEGRTFGELKLVTVPGSGYWFSHNDRALLLSSGRVLLPVTGTRRDADGGHRVARAYFSDDDGKTWKAGKAEVDIPMRGAMEPDMVELKDGRVLMVLRTQMGQIYAARSPDGGDTWSAAKPWGIRSPEAPAAVRRIPATGDLLLVWNDNYEPGRDHQGRRRPLTAAVSQDDGQTWKFRRNLEERSDHTYAYTSVTYNRDRVLLSYYVADDKTGRISTRFRSLPLQWFYESQ